MLPSAYFVSHLSSAYLPTCLPTCLSTAPPPNLLAGSGGTMYGGGGGGTGALADVTASGAPLTLFRVQAAVAVELRALQQRYRLPIIASKHTLLIGVLRFECWCYWYDCLALWLLAECCRCCILLLLLLPLLLLVLLARGCGLVLRADWAPSA